MTVPPIPPSFTGDSSRSEDSPLSPSSSPRPAKRDKKSKKAVTHQKVQVASDQQKHRISPDLKQEKRQQSPDLRASGGLNLRASGRISKASSLPAEGSEHLETSIPLAASDSHTVIKVRRKRNSIIAEQAIFHPSSTEKTPPADKGLPPPDMGLPPPPPQEIGDSDKPKSKSPLQFRPMISREHSVLSVKSDNLKYGEYAKLHIEVSELKKASKSKTIELSHAAVADKPKIEKEIAKISADVKEKNKILNSMAVELLNNKEEFGRLLKDPSNHSIINSMLTVRTTFLGDRDKCKALANELVATYPLENLAGVLKYYVKKSISNAESPGEVLREVDSTLAFLLSIVQKRYMSPLVGKELAEICKDLERNAPKDLKSLNSSDVTRDTFIRIHSLMITTNIPKPMQELYQAIQTEYLKKWPDLENKEKKALGLITSVFFLQLVNPTIARGPKNNEVFNFAYKNDTLPIHVVTITKGLQAIVNNERPNEQSNDKNLQSEKFFNLIQEMQTISQSFARNLMGRHKTNDKKP